MSFGIKLSAFLITLLLMAGVFLLLVNSHLSFFPCQIWEYDPVLESHRVLPREQMCSLLQKRLSGGPNEDRVELTFAGHVAAVILIVVVPLVSGLLYAGFRSKNAEASSTSLS